MVEDFCVTHLHTHGPTNRSKLVMPANIVIRPNTFIQVGKGFMCAIIGNNKLWKF